jgi:phosphatidylinositol alpha 1,6-mannosyltransferase
MRIAHVADVCLPNVGGIEILVDDLARRQAAAGHDVTILTPSPGPSSRSHSADSSIEVLRPRHPVGLGRHVVDVRRRISAGDFDVVHGHLSVASAFTSVVGGYAARNGTALTLTVHSMWNGRVLAVKAIGGLVGWRSWPARWTAVSAAAADDVRRVLGAGAEVAVVPNAVESQWWRDSVAQRVTSPGRPITFVSVMRMVERKRPMALVRALQAARASVPRDVAMRAVLVGDGPLATVVRDELRRRHMSDWVAMTGQLSRDEVRDCYALADVYVAPADRESFGIAALEARAAGLAVIAMSKGGVGDFVRDGVEGLLCEDDAQLVRSLSTAATHPRLVETIVEHNRAVAPSIAWDSTLAGYLACYEQAADLVEPSLPHPSSRSLVSQW